MINQSGSNVDFFSMAKVIDNVFPLLDPALNFDEAKKRHILLSQKIPTYDGFELAFSEKDRNM